MEMSRREFLLTLPAGAALSAAAPALVAATGPRIGSQINAFPLEADDFSTVLAALESLKGLGFDGFEAPFRFLQAHYPDAPAVRRQIEGTGLACFGVHIFLTSYDPQTRIAPMELVRAQADGAAALGAQRLILSGAGVAKDGQVSEADLAGKVEGLNAAGRYCRDKGIRLAYHNHGPEFAAGGAEMAGLLARTDPALVDFLVDCGWAHHAKVNLAEFFSRNRQRIVGMHLRDFKGETQVPLGQGEVDYKPLAAAVRETGWTGWALAEEERGSNASGREVAGAKLGESAVAPARQTLRALFGR